MSYIEYHSALEVRDADEMALFTKIADTFTEMNKTVQKAEGRAVRSSHAKSTGLLKGQLTVDANLAPELAQGLFATPARYDAIVRLAQGPGELLDDKISTHRGMAIKLLSVPGERIRESPEFGTQDWVLEAESKAFINADATKFFANLKAGVSNAPSLPDAVKGVVSSLSRATNAALDAVGAPSKTLGFFGHEPRHPLAESYFSQAPIRWGRHVAKLGAYPAQSTLDSLSDMKIDNSDDFNAFRQAVIDHFVRQGAAFELRVQLATNIDAMPIEDASVEWPEDMSPYRRVGILTLPPQNAWTTDRAAYVDERLSFQPANSIAEHRPLGQVMRARLFVYERLVAVRQEANDIERVEPNSLADIPD